MENFLCTKHGPQSGILFHPPSLKELEITRKSSGLVYLSGIFDGIWWLRFLVYTSFIENLDSQGLKHFFQVHADYTHGICPLCFYEITTEIFDRTLFPELEIVED